MGKLLVLGLIVAWVAVLGPSLFQRSDDRAPKSLDAARDRLASLHHGRRQSLVARTPSRPDRAMVSPFAAARASGAARRRRHVAGVLGFAVVGSLLLTIATGNLVALALHLLFDAVFVAFVITLRSRRRYRHAVPNRRAAAPAPRSAPVYDMNEFDGYGRDFDAYPRLRAANE